MGLKFELKRDILQKVKILKSNHDLNLRVENQVDGLWIEVESQNSFNIKISGYETEALLKCEQVNVNKRIRNHFLLTEFNELFQKILVRMEIDLLIDEINAQISDEFNDNSVLTIDEENELIERINEIEHYVVTNFKSLENGLKLTKKELKNSFEELKEEVKSKQTKKKLSKYILGGLIFIFKDVENAKKIFNYLIQLSNKMGLPEFITKIIK